MKFLITDIKLPIRYTDDEAVSYLKHHGFPNGKITIYKKSIDARKKEGISFVYTFLAEAASIPPKYQKKAVAYTEPKMSIPVGDMPLPHRPVVVGAGPAGLFCAYLLAKRGYCPIVLERGEPIGDRVKTVHTFFAGGALNPESNVQFGEGGAGAFSDGKLTTRIHDPLSREVVALLARHSGLAHLTYQAKPHIGTDYLRQCVENLRNEIVSLGGEVRFGSRLTDLHIRDGKLKHITINHADTLPVSAVVLATGHSARDIYHLLDEKGVSMAQKAFSVGGRVEHWRRVIDEIQYGAYAGHPHLGAADYSLFHHCQNGHTVYSFCMCPGGVVVPSQSEEETILVNGMSDLARDGQNSNSALCISVSNADFGGGLFDGLCWIEQLEKTAYRLGGGGYRAPFMTSGDLTGVRPTGAYPEPTYARGVQEVDWKQIFPGFIMQSLQEGLQAFERKMPGFLSRGAVFTGVETRTSSPLRILRNEAFQSEDALGLYPCGEGAGYAGGIVSAGVDGFRVALAIMKQYRPFG